MRRPTYLPMLTKAESSVTRWVHCFSIFGRLQSENMTNIIKLKIAEVG